MKVSLSHVVGGKSLDEACDCGVTEPEDVRPPGQQSAGGGQPPLAPPSMK